MSSYLLTDRKLRSEIKYFPPLVIQVNTSTMKVRLSNKQKAKWHHLLTIASWWKKIHTTMIFIYSYSIEGALSKAHMTPR